MFRASLLSAGNPAGPRGPLGKIDWIFTRGLRVAASAMLPALAADGTSLSDHDRLLVKVETNCWIQET
jgi:hypothetical protein